MSLPYKLKLKYEIIFRFRGKFIVYFLKLSEKIEVNFQPIFDKKVWSFLWALEYYKKLDQPNKSYMALFIIVVLVAT